MEDKKQTEPKPIETLFKEAMEDYVHNRYPIDETYTATGEEKQYLKRQAAFNTGWWAFNYLGQNTSYKELEDFVSNLLKEASLPVEQVKNFMAHAYFQGALDRAENKASEAAFNNWYSLNKDAFSLHQGSTDERSVELKKQL